MSPRYKALRIAAVVLLVFQGFGAVGGGGVLMLGPRGEIMPLPLSLLSGSPFSTYFVPGLVLFTVLGVGPLIVAVLAWRRPRLAPLLTIGVGGALLIWMAVEIAIIGYSNDPPLQPIYLAVGAALCAVGIGWQRTRGTAA
jgi:hypothetical protein